MIVTVEVMLLAQRVVNAGLGTLLGDMENDPRISCPQLQAAGLQYAQVCVCVT